MCVGCLYLFFFFEQKTAYELLISDWSSDVCSSDLLSRPARVKPVWYATHDKLVPAYYVEIFGRRAASPTTVAWSYVIGEDGSSLFARDLVAYDAAQPFSYRVFADASGSHQPFDSPLGNGYMPFTDTGIDDELPRGDAGANLVSLVDRKSDV